MSCQISVMAKSNVVSSIPPIKHDCINMRGVDGSRAVVGNLYVYSTFLLVMNSGYPFSIFSSQNVISAGSLSSFCGVSENQQYDAGPENRNLGCSSLASNE